MKRKGQAAMEFLMTYGWAIIVVLAAIAALAYFGVLSPQKLLPERTTFAAPISNIDNAVVDVSGTIQIAFKNNVGVPILLTGNGGLSVATSVTCTPASGVDVTWSNRTTIATTTQIGNGDTFLVTWTCDPDATSPAEAGDKFKGENMFFEYTNAETGQARKQSGSVDGKYQ